MTLETGRDMVQAQEWLQLNIGGDAAEKIAPGFSGAGVYLPETGEFIGMITDAELSTGGFLGRMLPADRLRRYWEELDDYLPHEWLPEEPRRSLRRILTDVTSLMPLEYIVSEAFPGERSPRSLFPLAGPLSSFASAAMASSALALFGEFAGTTSDFPRSCISGVPPQRFLSDPLGNPHRRASVGSPGSRAWRFRTCPGSLTARGPPMTRA